MAPWLPPIVVYCPPAQQCSAVAPPAPPRPHPRPRPVPPPCRCPPYSPPPPHPPRASPAISLWGRRGGAHGGCALGSLLLGGRGGASVACVMGPPTCAILGRVSRLGYTSRARRWRGAPGIARERPVRRAPAGRNAPPLCARRTARTAGVPPGDKVAGRLATASRLVRPPLAAGRVRRGRLTRSPLFPLCIALPQLLHSPMVAPRLRLGAGLCAGGAAQAPQLVKPGKNPVYPSDCHGNRA